MIDRDHKLSVSRQAKALGISRGSIYYLSRPTPEADLKLMRRMDELHLEYPFAGSRMLKGLLTGEGHEVGRCHVTKCVLRTAPFSRCLQVLTQTSSAMAHSLPLRRRSQRGAWVGIEPGRASTEDPI